MKTAVLLTIVIVTAMSTVSFAQGMATSPKDASPKDTSKIEANSGKVVTATPRQKNHFLKKHESQEKKPTAKKSGS